MILQGYGFFGIILGAILLVSKVLKFHAKQNELAAKYNINYKDLERYSNKVMDEYFHQEYNHIKKYTMKSWLFWIVYLFIYVSGFVFLANI